jgi:hypothetical protein
MTGGAAWQFAYVVAALVTAWAMVVKRRDRAMEYCCPVCSTRKPENHSESCPWKRRD